MATRKAGRPLGTKKKKRGPRTTPQDIEPKQIDDNPFGNGSSTASVAPTTPRVFQPGFVNLHKGLQPPLAEVAPFSEQLHDVPEAALTPGSNMREQPQPVSPEPILKRRGRPPGSGKKKTGPKKHGRSQVWSAKMPDLSEAVLTSVADMAQEETRPSSILPNCSEKRGRPPGSRKKKTGPKTCKGSSKVMAIYGVMPNLPSSFSPAVDPTNLPSPPSLPSTVVGAPNRPSSPNLPSPAVETPNRPSSPSLPTPAVEAPNRPSSPSSPSPAVEVLNRPSSPSLPSPAGNAPNQPSFPCTTIYKVELTSTQAVDAMELPSMHSATVNTSELPNSTLPSRTVYAAVPTLLLYQVHQNLHPEPEPISLNVLPQQESAVQQVVEPMNITEPSTTGCESKPAKSAYARLFGELAELMTEECFKGYNMQDGPQVTLVRLYCGDNPGIKTSVRINEDFTASIKVHRVEVDKDHDIWTGLPRYFKSLSDIKILLTKLNSYNVCVGNYEKDMVNLVPVGTCISSKDSGITAYREGDFGACLRDHRYSTTVRSTKCAFLIPQGIQGVRCTMCQKYRGTLRKVLSRQAQADVKEKPASSLSWKKANSQMTKQELIAKINDYKDYTKTLEWQISQKNQEIRQLMRSQGAMLKEKENTDFENIFKECTPMVEKSYKDPHCFQRLFWHEQRRQMALSSKKSMRWHPMIIKWCLYLKSTSTKAYGALRNVGFVSLPSERTLFDYSHALPSKTGFQPEYAEHLIKEATQLGMYKDDWRSYVGVLHDEMKIKEDLVYDRNTGELVGYMDLDKYGNTLLELERTIKEKKQTVAKHVLVIMVRGITSSLKYPFAAFATDGITADLLYTVLWRALGILEHTCGLKVLFMTCDGASPNRRFFSINYVGDGDKRVGYWTVNRFARDGRRLFFVSDVPHLLKTARNCFANSGSGSRTRRLWKDDKDISWMHIVQLYEEHVLPNVFTQAHKLTHAHVHLTPFSKMKVNLAAQLMSNTVANALDLNYGEYVSETVNFIRHLNRFFDCMNTRHPSESDETLNKDLAKYTQVDDSRLTYLTTEFLGYFNDWRRSIENRYGHLDKSDKAKMMLSHQTLNGLVITVSSIVDCVKFLLTEGAEYVLTHRFNQDPLEAHFSHYRHKGGANDNPTLYDVKNTLSTLRIIGSTALDPVRGNVTCHRKRDNDICNEPLPKRRR